jgi:uncharacterized protein YrrD
MLDKAKALNGYKLNSLDGEIGKVKDFYFDDQYWTIRYLIADTGTWLTSRQVLISLYALSAVHRSEKQIAVNLTRQQIEDSPPLDSDKPVSQQFENYYFGYHGWPGYWDGPYSWGAYPFIDLGQESLSQSNLGGKKWDPHLRSIRHVDGYHVKANDGEIGHVEDFLIDDKTWAIRYLVIDTQNWLPGKRVLISPQWIETISWTDSSIFVNVPRETIKGSPEYINESSLTRDYETRLHRHFNHRGYWVDEPVAPVPLV